MALKPSVKTVFTMPYRGVTQTWSNRYHFDGVVPAGDADWIDLFSQLSTWHRAIIPAGGVLHELVGYLAGSEVPVFSDAVDLAGNAEYGVNDIPCPGDVAALVRFSTTQRTSKNHPIYLFKYIHQAMHQVGSPDTISVNMKSVLDTVMQKWVDGTFTIGGTSVFYCGPNGAVAQTRTTETYLTHRDFRR